jgi:hypothetical protein
MAVNRNLAASKKQQKLNKIEGGYADIVADLDIVLDKLDTITSSTAEARERADAAIAILHGTAPTAATQEITVDEAIEALPAESRRIARMAANGQLTEDWIRNANQHLHNVQHSDVVDAPAVGPLLSAIDDAVAKAAHALDAVNAIPRGLLSSGHKIDEAIAATQEAKTAIDRAKQEADAATPPAPAAPQPIALPAGP